MTNSATKHDKPTVAAWVPYSIEAEQALLGALMLHNRALELIDGTIKPEHFYEDIHRQIYEAMHSLVTMGKAATPTVLKAVLPSGLEVGPGMTLSKYLARLAAEATTIINVVDYAEVIRDLHQRRLMAEIGYELVRPVPQNTPQLAAEAIDALDQIVADRSIGGIRRADMRQSVAEAVDEIARAYETDGAIQGLSWGISSLDKKTHGMDGGDLIVVAGRPGMGKTAFGISVARNLGKDGKPGVIFSQEMSRPQLTQRMIADEMYDIRPLQFSSMRSGRFEESVFHSIVDAGKRIAELPIVIDDQPKLTVSQVCARARRLKRSKNIQWLMIDHLHLMKLSGNYRGNVTLEYGEITSTLKALAKELKIPIILLCQLSRQVEGRDDKRPQLADLRWSGDIEQDADMVIMLYREEYYVARREPDARPDSEEYATWQIEMGRCHNKLDAIFEKQRQGSTGPVRLHCNIACNAIRALADQYV